MNMFGNFLINSLFFVGARKVQAQQGCEPGTYFDQVLQRCQKCAGCGSYQDEAGQSSCKTATIESCGVGKVPKLAISARSLASACAEVPAGNYFDDTSGGSSSNCFPINRCRGCGSYQDEVGQPSCKTATIESCGVGKVPKFTGQYEIPSTLASACAEVPAGKFFQNISGDFSNNCFPISTCLGCGSYQDEVEQTSCKTATVESCGVGKVPKFTGQYEIPSTLASACAEVPAGSYFLKNFGSSCFPIFRCSGCGSYQDEVGQTSCKTATLESCGVGRVPKFIRQFEDARTLAAACVEVPAGSYFKNQSGVVSTMCFPIKKCTGCGSYQDEVGQTSCKKALCSSGEMKRFKSGAVMSQDVCTQTVEAGTFYNSSENCVRSCMGCGLYSLANASKCTTASCENGTFPIVSFEAGSPAQACRAPKSGEGISTTQCSVRPCNKRVTIAQEFTCANFKRYTSFSHIPFNESACATESATNSSLTSFNNEEGIFWYNGPLCGLSPEERQGCNCPVFPTPSPSPTQSPTPRPTSSPTQSPTPSPTSSPTPSLGSKTANNKISTFLTLMVLIMMV